MNHGIYLPPRDLVPKRFWKQQLHSCARWALQLSNLQHGGWDFLFSLTKDKHADLLTQSLLASRSWRKLTQMQIFSLRTHSHEQYTNVPHQLQPFMMSRYETDKNKSKGENKRRGGDDRSENEEITVKFECTWPLANFELARRFFTFF